MSSPGGSIGQPRIWDWSLRHEEGGMASLQGPGTGSSLPGRDITLLMTNADAPTVLSPGLPFFPLQRSETQPHPFETGGCLLKHFK